MGWASFIPNPVKNPPSVVFECARQELRIAPGDLSISTGLSTCSSILSRLQVTWQGEGDQQLRAVFALVNGQPVVRDLLCAKARPVEGAGAQSFARVRCGQRPAAPLRAAGGASPRPGNLHDARRCRTGEVECLCGHQQSASCMIARFKVSGALGSLSLHYRQSIWAEGSWYAVAPLESWKRLNEKGSVDGMMPVPEVDTDGPMGGGFS